MSPFAWSTRYIDIALATIILNSWHMFFIFSRNRQTARYETLARGDYLLITSAYLGIVLVTISQVLTDTESLWQSLTDLHTNIQHTLIGVLLAILSVIFASHLSHKFEIGDNLYTNLVASHSIRESNEDYHNARSD